MGPSKSAERRKFLATTTSAALGALAAPQVSRGSDRDKLRLAIVGIHGRGQHLALGFAQRNDCEVAYLCDVDETLFAGRVDAIADLQKKPPKTVQDFRHALDDQAVDAIVVATPDHWHALATVWGCQADKDVYVEKPASHTPWEGRQMVNASRRYQRIVQVGTQNRSAPYNMAAKEYLDSGKLGSVHLVRVFNQKSWPNVGAVKDSDTPAGLDWDMWNGPAQLPAYNANQHDHWNHYWSYSGGDIINDGVHQIDLARWLIGKEYPESVYSSGGRYAQGGAFETPDTQVAVFQYDDLVMTFELTLFSPYMLKSDPVLRNSDMTPYWPQNATRIEIYGTKGVMYVGRHGGGWEVYDRPRDRQPVVRERVFGRFPDPEHKQNFVDCIRDRTTPNADILDGHRSTLLCQYANISYRLGGANLKIDAEKETVVGNDAANAMLKREYRAPWAVPEIA